MKLIWKEKIKNKRIIHIGPIKVSYSKKNIEQPAKQYNERLTKEEWSEIYNKNQIQEILSNIKNKNLTCQTQEMLNLVKENEKVLEIGCGSGMSSICLKKFNNAEVTALDYQMPSLELVKSACNELNIDLRTICVDAFKETPFEKGEFDYIFSAGLLEHFNFKERLDFLKLWKPYCKRMVQMVPNAASVAYRTGKQIMEQEGSWIYGKETPLYTQIPEFIQAGYVVEKEYTIGAAHALNFLSDKNPLKETIKNWIENNNLDDDCHQGYLLVTIGRNIEINAD